MNSPKPWRVLVDRDVHKQLNRIPNKDADRILVALSAMATNPFSGDVLKMQGEDNVWRRRIGAYRIFFEITNDSREVYIYRVERRTSSTY